MNFYEQNDILVLITRFVNVYKIKSIKERLKALKSLFLDLFATVVSNLVSQLIYRNLIFKV